MSFNLPNPSLIGILLIISTHSGPQLIYKYPEDINDQNSIRSNVPKFKDLNAVDAYNTDQQDIKHINENDDDDDDELYKPQEDGESFTERDLFEFGNLTFEAWDSHHLDYYLGTKLDLRHFLDEQEERRKYFHKLRQAAAKTSADPSTTTVLSTDKARAASSSPFGDKQKLKKTVSKTSSTPSQSPSTNTNGTTTTSTSNTTTTPSKVNNEIFGIDPAYLCEMLAPPKRMCNSRFEIKIEDKIFLGLPVHRYDNGLWRNEKKPKKHHRDEIVEEEDDMDYVLQKHFQYATTENKQSDNVNKKAKLNLNMFHLVFVMNPALIESTYRVDEMFHYVISRLSLVLRYEQLKHDYICDEVKQILNLRDQYEGAELQNALVENTSLCSLIRDCYISISTSKIANLLINGKVRSFQIPIKSEFHSLPDALVPYIPGSHLSSNVDLLSNTGLINVGETSRYGQSFSSWNNLNTEEENPEDVIMHFSLLLLDEPESIIRDIKTENNSTLAKFIKMIDPRQSLIKLSMQAKHLSATQIKSFAFHLIYWRRARVIQPLSTRSVYIVSPMAPISVKLFDDIQLFKQKFPTLPSLPHFLKLLSPQSRKPQQFAAVIPSKDHRLSYLDALGWLVRYGYVTQLQTFIWLKICKRIKIKVEEDLENENLLKRKKKNSNVIISPDNTSKPTDNSSKPTDNSSKPAPAKIGLLSEAEEEGIDKIKQRLDKTTIGPNVTLIDDDDTIILDPGRATTLERRWINKIITEECKLSPELTSVFYKLLKYMNGKSSLELLLLKENVSRNELRKLLFAIEDHIISVRHW